MAIGIPWRSELNSVVYPANTTSGESGGIMAAREESSANELAVTDRAGEILSSLAGAAPSGGDGANIAVREGSALGPNTGVEDADDDFGTVVGIGPKALPVSQAQELGRSSGVDITEAVLKHSEDGRVIGERGSAFGSEEGGEAMENG
ncbi:hypothetical protein IEQ34_008078 [Dendrobium chrysotoxum]|uniref:Uncharacterized protein n=1 Tax=Dendrobium chrysotoxum TaxID=161865 RepID=A0AAV7GM70_DENCH|nr:hypothetical protein IEQ34_007466 [Dendrobium chrysotoxum]KAH0463496.1 hypothetical protein IEQ34_008078 [Dendrobium chrysotoxum]